MSDGHSRMLFLTAASLLLILCMYRSPVLSEDPADTGTEGASEIFLAAHRGDSARCPENTMASFQAAVYEGADCIELDIQETLDHVFVVCHDQNLSRIAGLDRNISDMRYEELRQVDAGSWFSPEFCGQYIPTLEEVLRFGRGTGLYLNIEIKSALSAGSEKALLSLLRRCRMEDQCILACQDYSVLTRLKACAPEIRTLYVTADPPSDLAALTDADEISIAYPAVDAELLRQAHTCGKRLHVWTVNSVQLLRRMAALHPDVLITDDPVLARRVLDAL